MTSKGCAYNHVAKIDADAEIDPLLGHSQLRVRAGEILSLSIKWAHGKT
jgi:hypothetical protein